MPIWYLKCPRRHEDHEIGPEIFFGGPKLPKKPPERERSKPAGPGGSGRWTQRLRPPSMAVQAGPGGSGGPGLRNSPILPINIVPGTQFEALSLC
ncbi:hypothetical protein JCGZ_15448 [Jatropha curcas]|uniref:Uncharacterized protein n=1 Tax=Jatropha curcas TaxID=180498 RepID=A0A067K5I6_JATCU|nr:hypothetical protein JCGZ_15448 [Jatropha curcas]